MAKPPHTNALVNETSPYLLQHAHNPVNWHPWNEMTLARARSLDKMLLISIGYSACHWCHVMERESFEDGEVARIMNEYFICIKVDREERPDVDQVYMNAVQLITGGGGWPLNCFALPDGRPFFGGTYFRKNQWIQLLENIALLYSERRKELVEQAEALTSEVRSYGLIRAMSENMNLSGSVTDEAIIRIKSQFDLKEGGFVGAPKFPMPSNLYFLLRYSYFSKDKDIAGHLKLTLQKMAYGGIYDQLGGGFARYSTDVQWKVPHFEKMLYDNAQLASLYTEAWRSFRDPLYREIAEDTLQFVRRELTSPEGGFYSALDADSEGAEGKFYTWGTAEFNLLLGSYADIIRKYYHIGDQGYWESGRNILLRTRAPEDFAREQGFQPSAFKAILKTARSKLLKARNKRIRPGLDHKILVSWNALMMKAFIEASLAFSSRDYLDIATRNALYLLENATRADGGLNHTVSTAKKPVNGFLEDYACLVNALISLYQACFDQKWLDKALQLTEYAILHFHDPATGLFFFTSGLDPALVSRKTEIYDQVIPSSNSIMAENLALLGQFYEREDLSAMADKMLSHVEEMIAKHPSSFSNWATVLLTRVKPFYTVVITGPEFMAGAMGIRRQYFPNVILCGIESGSGLPVFRNRFTEGKTSFHVCSGRECKMPVFSVEEACRHLGAI